MGMQFHEAQPQNYSSVVVTRGQASSGANVVSIGLGIEALVCDIVLRELVASLAASK